MTREEQIKEITMLTCPAYCRNKDKKCAGVQDCDMKCLHYQRCEIVYDNANYRKQVETETVNKIFDELFNAVGFDGHSVSIWKCNLVKIAEKYGYKVEGT